MLDQLTSNDLPSSKPRQGDDDILVTSDVEFVGEVDGEGDGRGCGVDVESDRNILEERHRHSITTEIQ